VSISQVHPVQPEQVGRSFQEGLGSFTKFLEGYPFSFNVKSFKETSDDRAPRAVISVIKFSLLSTFDYYLRSRLSSRRPVSLFNPPRNEISLSNELLS
jgi:hypothetical protein